MVRFGRVAVAAPWTRRSLPPFSSGPWQRTQPTPSWFSSVNGRTAELAALDRERLQLLLLREVPARLEEPLQREPRPRRTTISTTPQPWSRWRTGVSSAVSDGPGPHRVRDLGALGLRAGAAGRARRSKTIASSPPRTSRAIAVVFVSASIGRPAPSPSPRRTRLAAAARSCRSRAAARGRSRTCRRSPGRPRSSIWKRSRPRGAGPSWYSPARLYFDPWHGHSNHFEDVAERHPAAQVHAALVQRHDPLGGDALGRVVGLRRLGRAVPRHEVEAAGAVVDAARRSASWRLDVGRRCPRRSSSRTRRAGSATGRRPCRGRTRRRTSARDVISRPSRKKSRRLHRRCTGGAGRLAGRGRASPAWLARRNDRPQIRGRTG